MGKITIKNKRSKMSPNGVITLSVAARKALGMKVNEPGQIKISSDKKSVVLSASSSKSKKTFRVSKKGITSLKGDEKELLLKNEKRHYWMQIDDTNKEVRLLPY